MRRPLTGLRLGVVFLFVLGLMSPVASIGVGAQDLTCDDFNSQRAAQAILDADPLLEESLDPDGNGIACDHDDDDVVTDGEDDAVTDDDDNGPVSNDGATFLEDIQDELDLLIEQVDRFLEIDEIGADATQEEVDEALQIAADWAEYPDVASEFVAPDGFEEIEDAYLDVADAFGESGELWEEFWATESDSPEEAIALDDFNDVFIDAQNQIFDVQVLLDDAGGAEPSDDPVGDPADDPSDDPADDPSGDGDAYVSDIQGELELLTEQSERFLELFESGTAEDAEEINEIAADWVEYPDVAFAFVAPEGFEDIEDAYLDLADTFGETGELWEEFWAIPAEDDDEEEIAFAAFEDAFNDAQDQIADVQDLLDDAGSGPGADDPTDDPTDGPDDDPTDDPTDEPPAAGDVYVADIQDELDLLSAQVDRFLELYNLGAAEGSDEINDLAADWVEYPDIAAEFTAPTGTVGFEGIEAAYFDLAETLGEAGELWEEFWAIPAEDDDEEAIALEAFEEVFFDAQDQIADLQDLLDEAGGSGPSRDDPVDDPADDPDDDPTDDPDADTGDYLAEVRENADALIEGFDRFNEIIALGADATEEDFSEAGEIVFSWVLAPDVAAELDVPAGMEEVQDAFEAFTDEVGMAGIFISEWLAADIDSPEADEAFDNFFDALDASEELYDELDALLEDEGE